MKTLLLTIFLWAGCAMGMEPVSKPETESRVKKNLLVLTENINRARKNLAAATHNIGVLTAELSALDKLQRDYEALSIKYKGFPDKGTSPDKALTLIKGAHDGQMQVEIQRAPLLRQLEAWKERQAGYGAILGDFEKKRAKLEVDPVLISPNPD